MKVRELIELLKKSPQDWIVMYDCLELDGICY